MKIEDCKVGMRVKHGAMRGAITAAGKRLAGFIKVDPPKPEPPAVGSVVTILLGTTEERDAVVTSGPCTTWPHPHAAGYQLTPEGEGKIWRRVTR